MDISEKTTGGGCFLRIKALYNSLKQAELRVADYILTHPEKVVNSTIKELQRETGSSYATIIRFCKKAGYAGFKEFKNSLISDLSQTKTITDIAAGFQIKHDDTIETIVRKTFQSSMKTLEETKGILNASDLEKTAQKMLNAGFVYFIGTGISGVSVQYAFTRFFRIGITCSWETDPTIYKLKTAVMQESSILFAISSSGRSANVVDAARIARERNIDVISLCDFAISPLTRISTINLYTTPRNTTQFYDLDVQLIIAQINIIDILFFYCCSRLGQKAIDLLNATKDVADREKM